MFKFFLWFLLIISLSSCVSNKRTVLFQGEPTTRSDIYKLNNIPYKLQVGDVIVINIKSINPKLVSLFKPTENITTNNQNGKNVGFNGYTIDRHGNIRLPYLGELNVLGFTVKEVIEKIENGLKLYLKNTDKIFVQVMLSGFKLVVSGEVRDPGTINLQQNQVTIVEAIANAGGITETGDKTDIAIIRKTVDGVKKYKVDLTNIDIFNSDLYYIQPNDIIYVKPIKRKSWGIGTTGLGVFTTFISIFSVVTSTILIVKTF